MLNRIITRVWDSPTLMTWSSLATRSISFVFVLPLLLRKFSPSDLALWYIFATLASLQILAELGFGATFVRFIAYALSDDSGGVNGPRDRSQQTVLPIDSLEQVVGTMNRLYWWLTLLLSVALFVGGTLVLRRPINNTASPHLGWTAWGIVYLTTLIVFRGNYYSTWLQGSNQIAILRRWETIISFASILTSLATIKFGYGLLPLIAASQFWSCAGTVMTIFLANRVLDGRLKLLSKQPPSMMVLRRIWPAAWRSATGIFMSQGFTQVSALLYAQVGNAKDVASYLLAVRIQQTFATMANAPFYSKIPYLARLWMQGNKQSIIQIARRSMSMSLWAFALPMVGLGVLGPHLFDLLKSKTPFPQEAVWALLAIAGITERYGAMHLQLYSLSNKIVWHIANGVTGVLFVMVSWLAFPFLHVIALPLGMVFANLAFYTWYCARKSHRTFDIQWPQFDAAVAGGPFAVISLYLIYLTVR